MRWCKPSSPPPTNPQRSFKMDKRNVLIGVGAAVAVGSALWLTRRAADGAAAHEAGEGVHPAHGSLDTAPPAVPTRFAARFGYLLGREAAVDELHTVMALNTVGVNVAYLQREVCAMESDVASLHGGEAAMQAARHHVIRITSAGPSEPAGEGCEQRGEDTEDADAVRLPHITLPAAAASKLLTRIALLEKNVEAVQADLDEHARGTPEQRVHRKLLHAYLHRLLERLDLLKPLLRDSTE
ncbi:hypothetical protein EON66_00690 [archaeon]|nr:MAG: hypothetical protein EON66_00690 [archaeon]